MARLHHTDMDFAFTMKHNVVQSSPTYYYVACVMKSGGKLKSDFASEGVVEKFNEGGSKFISLHYSRI